MSGELWPTEPETPELIVLRGEVQKLHDDIAAASLGTVPAGVRINPAYGITLDSRDGKVSVQDDSGTLASSKHSIFFRNGIWYVERDLMSTSEEVDAGMVLRKMTMYPIRGGGNIMTVVRKGFRLSEGGFEDKLPLERSSRTMDDSECPNLFKMTEDIRRKVFLIPRVEVAGRRTEAGELGARILGKFHHPTA